MCSEKPSQTFFIGGNETTVDGKRQLLEGAGVLTDLISTKPVTVGVILRLRDGRDTGAKILVELQASSQHYFGGMNLEFEQGLFAEWVAGPGPSFANYTVAGYIQDDSPDVMTTQMIRIREALLEMNAKLAKFADFVEGLYKGDPAA